MRRLFTLAVAVAAVLAFTASPAAAVNSGQQPPGPPHVSGGDNAVVFHCNSEVIGGDRGVVILNQNGINSNNCTTRSF